MQVQAVSIGQAVPRANFDAVIQSVFDSAVNLRLVHENRLLTLLLSEHYDLPQGIRIARKDVLFRPLVVSQDASTRGGVLRFHSYPLTVDLRGALVWECHVPNLNINMNAPFAQQAWSTAWLLLNKGQRLYRTDIIAEDLFQRNKDALVSQRVSAPVVQLISSTKKYDVQTAIQATQSMIGLGQGVTPSGDDILIGFLAGLWSLAGENRARLSFIHSFGNALVPLTAQTNEISRTYIHHATQGQFPRSLSDLAEAIAWGGDVEHALQIAMRVGHSSGMDSVTGLLIGLSVWNKTYSFV
jgi:hypothetical protein